MRTPTALFLRFAAALVLAEAMGWIRVFCCYGLAFLPDHYRNVFKYPTSSRFGSVNLRAVSVDTYATEMEWDRELAFEDDVDANFDAKSKIEDSARWQLQLLNETGKSDLKKQRDLMKLIDGASSDQGASSKKLRSTTDKRVILTIRYSGEAGLKPYFLTLANKLKLLYPDVVIERRILADVEEDGDEPTFEVLVDGKIIIGRGKKQRAEDNSAVFVSMHELDLAIAKARRRRRPSSTPKV